MAALGQVEDLSVPDGHSAKLDFHCHHVFLQMSLFDDSLKFLCLADEPVQSLVPAKSIGRLNHLSLALRRVTL